LGDDQNTRRIRTEFGSQLPCGNLNQRNLTYVARWNDPPLFDAELGSEVKDNLLVASQGLRYYSCKFGPSRIPPSIRYIDPGVLSIMRGPILTVNTEYETMGKHPEMVS